MRKHILLLMFLFSINIVFSSSVQYGEIRLEVINRPPTITSINLLPEKPYYDDILECNIVVNDETPDQVTYKYNWYVNNEPQDTNKRTFSDFEEGDTIRCSAVPIDLHGLQGEKAQNNTQILSAPVHVKALKPALSMAGIDVSAKVIAENTNMAAITGMATGYRENSSITLFFMLSIFTLILIGINLIGLIITVKRKLRSPKQDSQSA